MLPSNMLLGINPYVALNCKSGCGQEIAGDAIPDVVDAIEEMGEEGMKAIIEDFIDTAELEIAAQSAGPALSVFALTVGHEA